jgi:hypothetical protein
MLKKNTNTNKKIKEKMSDTSSSSAQTSYSVVYSVFHSIIGLYALYLSYKCNQGFNFGAVLLACCCPWLYVVYHLVTSGGCMVTGNVASY